MTNVESIKEEAFKFILSYNGLLNRRKSSVADGMEDVYMFRRRSSEYRDEIQRNLKEITKHLISKRSFQENMKDSPLQKEKIWSRQISTDSPKQNSWFGRMRSFFTQK